MTSDPSEIDMRLQAALRHAPDAGIEPPPALDRRILDAARHALPGAGGKPARRWFAWLDALTRPAGAAAFASLLLGTTIALLWRGEVPPEAMPGAPVEVGAPAARPATPPATPELRATEPASVASAAAAAEVTTPQPAHEAAPPSAASRVRAAKAAPPSGTPPPAAQRDNAVRPEVAAPEAAPLPTPALAEAPAPPPIPSTPAAPAQDATAAAEHAAAPALGGAAMRSAVPPSPQMAKAGASRSRAQALPAFDPLAPTLAALADAPAAAQVLRELQAATQGRWTAVSVSAPATSDLLVRDASGRTLARLRLDGDGVIWQSLAAPASAWRATLDAGAVQNLRDRWSSAGGVTEPPPTTQPGR